MIKIMNILVSLIVMVCASVSYAGQGNMPEAKVATDYWPPFRIKQSDGKLGGIDLEMMDLIGKRMGVYFNVKRIPWPRCLLYMKSGDQDFMTGIAKTAEREEYIVYSDIPYYSCNPVFYTRKGSGIIITKYEDLKRLKIGYTRDSAYFPRFDADKSLRKVDKDSERQLLDMLVAGRLEAIIGTDCQVDYDILMQQLRGVIVKQPYVPDYSIDLYIGVSKKSRWKFRMREINRVLKELKAQGAIRSIAEKYIGDVAESPSDQ